MAYINGDELIKTIEAICHPADLTDLKRIIKNLKTADVHEVKHGKWIESYDNSWHYDCPFCNDGYATINIDERPYNFCPNCGAKMDKEETA